MLVPKRFNYPPPKGNKMSKQTKAQKITAAIIEGYKGLPGEFYMLKGLLCADRDDAMPYGSPARRKWKSLIDSGMVARRMDEMNLVVIDAAKAAVREEPIAASHASQQH